MRMLRECVPLGYDWGAWCGTRGICCGAGCVLGRLGTVVTMRGVHRPASLRDTDVIFARCCTDMQKYELEGTTRTSEEIQ
jgi:hypothetical protein